METRHEHETNRQQTRGLQSGRMVASVGLGEVDAPHSSSPGRKAPGGGGVPHQGGWGHCVGGVGPASGANAETLWSGRSKRREVGRREGGKDVPSQRS